MEWHRAYYLGIDEDDNPYDFFDVGMKQKEILNQNVFG